MTLGRNKIPLFMSAFLACVCATPGIAQKTGQITITKEQMNQINEIIQPARSAVEAILAKDNTGMYSRYQKDVQMLREMTNMEEKRASTQKILANYGDFFANIWKNAAVDEKIYQAKIREVFPTNMREVIRFDNYLGFSMVTPPTAPPPAPLPADQCIDVCSIAKGSVLGSSYLISGGGGSYGNCFARVNSWGAAAAFGEISAGLKNSISIPGTFVDDARRLAISVAYDMKIEATAFAVLGASVASSSVTNGWTRQYMMIFAPVIFATHRIEQTTIQENFIVDKNAIGNYNVSAGSSVLNMIISASWGTAEASNIRWTVCETK
jgi:hypothetical protein